MLAHRAASTHPRISPGGGVRGAVYFPAMPELPGRRIGSRVRNAAAMRRSAHHVASIFCASRWAGDGSSYIVVGKCRFACQSFAAYRTIGGAQEAPRAGHIGKVRNMRRFTLCRGHIC